MESEKKTIKLVTSIKHIKVLKMLLMVIGAWPGEAIGENMPKMCFFLRKYIPLQSAIVTAGHIYFLYKKFRHLNFFDLGHVYLTAFLTALTMMRSAMANFKKYGDISNFFISKIHSIHYRHLNKFCEKEYKLFEKLSQWYSIYLCTSMILASVFFNVSAMYKNIRMGIFTHSGNKSVPEFSINYMFPGLEQVDHFYSYTLYNIILSFSCGISVCCTDLYLSLIVFQIIGQIRRLRYNLKNFPSPKNFRRVEVRGNKDYVTVDMYSVEENRTIRDKLLESIQHHSLILSFTNDISSFFGPMLAVYYLFHLVSCCLFLLQCSTLDPEPLSRYGVLTVIIFGQLIQSSVIFEIIASESEKLIDSVYLVPWECMDRGNRRVFLMMLNRVQKPIQVTAMGSIPVGVQTMTAILKTTFSYFAFLRSLNE